MWNRSGNTPISPSNGYSFAPALIQSTTFWISSSGSLPFGGICFLPWPLRALTTSLESGSPAITTGPCSPPLMIDAWLVKSIPSLALAPLWQPRHLAKTGWTVENETTSAGLSVGGEAGGVEDVSLEEEQPMTKTAEQITNQAMRFIGARYDTSKLRSGK